MNNSNGTTELATQDSPASKEQAIVSSFANKAAFEHIQRVANVFSESELVPSKYQKKPANCIIALEMATRMGVSPLMVMQNLDIILGRPCWSSQFLIASLNACGRFSPVRYEEDAENGGRTRAWAMDIKNSEKLYGVWVTMEMAKSEGWIDKNGSKWKTMPELMRRYRAASFFTKQFAPEISMGFQTQEEMIDIEAIEVDAPQNIADEITLDQLRALYELKKDKLTPSDDFSARRILGLNDGGTPEPKSFTKLYNQLKSL